MKKRVCMVVPSFTAKGGITTVVNGYVGSDLESKYDVKYIETYCDGKKLKKIHKALQAYLQFIKEMVLNKPDIVHIHSSFGGSFYRKLPIITLAHMLKIQTVNHIHGADFEKFYLNASEQKKRLIENIYNKYSMTIVLSEEWRNKIKMIVPEETIMVIENYSLLNERVIEKRKGKKNNHNVLFLGFVCKRKGCYDIPDIVKQVVKKVPDVIFIMAGDGEIDAVKEITDLEISNHIRYPGWIRGEEKDKYLSEADLFFLPSYNEGMPMCILDAMGCGLPIVSTTVGGIPKIVWHEKNGYIYNPGDKTNMSEAIIRILLDGKIRKEYGEKSIEIAQKNFSLKQHINKIVELYSCLI